MKSRRCEVSGLFLILKCCSPSFISLYIYSQSETIPLSRIDNSLRRDFLCKGTACVSGRQVPLSLTVSGYYGSLPQIEDGLSAPVSLQYKAGRTGFCPYTRRLGIPFHPVHCLLALSVLFPLSVLHKNHSPTRSRKSFKKRETRKCLTT